MQESSSLPLTHQVVAQLRACGHFLYYRMGGKIGRRRILAILSEHPNIPQKELQEILQIQSGSLSEVMNKLETDHLVEKGRSETDGRQWTVRLTENGKKEAQRLKAEYDRQVSQMMESLSQERLVTLHELLDVMFAHWIEVDKESEQENTKKANEQCLSRKSS